MPIKGQSPKEVMHTEMHRFKHGSLHSGSKHGPLVRSRAQAIAIGLSESGQSNKRADGGSVTAQDMADAAARKLKTQPYRLPYPNEPEAPKFASGGQMGNFNPERASAIGLSRQGMINSAVPGRTDKLNLNVPTGSYIIPADIPGAIGQGNSLAGAAILDKMFKSGPYGMNLGKASAGSRVGMRHSSLMKQMHFAEGGGAGDDYNTKLSPMDEKAFQLWRAKNMPNDSGADYDQRGAYSAGLNQQPNGHWEDQFKKPNHPTFSDQSTYAPYAPHGTWAGDTFVPPSPMAKGGKSPVAPIVAAGGEYIIHPSTVGRWSW